MGEAAMSQASARNIMNGGTWLSKIVIRLFLARSNLF